MILSMKTGKVTRRKFKDRTGSVGRTLPVGPHPPRTRIFGVSGTPADSRRVVLTRFDSILVLVHPLSASTRASPRSFVSFLVRQARNRNYHGVPWTKRRGRRRYRSGRNGTFEFNPPRRFFALLKLLVFTKRSIMRMNDIIAESNRIITGSQRLRGRRSANFVPDFLGKESLAPLQSVTTYF